jgi:DNA repair ATPase RecN
MSYFSRHAKNFIVVAVLAVIAIAVFRFMSSPVMPQDFIDARIQGAMISQNIVTLSNQSVDDIAKINQLDKQGNVTEATNVALEAIQKSKDIRDQAVQLSDQVSKMTASLSEIDSFEARQAALEAISSRLALISRLINYSDYLNQLLQTLQARFAGQATNKNVETVINQINAEVTAINSFNNQATQAMTRFDAIVNKK